MVKEVALFANSYYGIVLFLTFLRFRSENCLSGEYVKLLPYILMVSDNTS